MWSTGRPATQSTVKSVKLRFLSQLYRLIIINNYLLIAHSLNEKHAASMPTMKNGIDASADWNATVEDAKCDINVVA